MLGLLFFLAWLSVVAGYIGIPAWLGEHHEVFHWDVALTSTAAVAAGVTISWLLYSKRAIAAGSLVRALALPQSFVENRYYIDDIYTWYVQNIQQKIIAAGCAWFEQTVIIGTVNAVAALAQGLGRLLRLFQTGVVQTYVLVFVAGILWLITRYLAVR